MSNELALLPKTLGDLRKTITDLRKLSERLEKATEGIEVLARHAETSGLANLARKIDDAATVIEGQVQQAPGAEMVTAAVDEIQKTLGSMAELIPGWSRPTK